jgi:hypothetical protein
LRILKLRTECIDSRSGWFCDEGEVTLVVGVVVDMVDRCSSSCLGSSEKRAEEEAASQGRFARASSVRASLPQRGVSAASGATTGKERAMLKGGEAKNPSKGLQMDDPSE